MGQISGVHLSFPSIEFSLLNIDTVVWVTERDLSLQVTLVLYYIFLVGTVFHLLLKELKNLSLRCKAVTALRETGFSLISNRLLEPDCTRWEANMVCADTGKAMPGKGYSSAGAQGVQHLPEILSDSGCRCG